MLFFFSAFMFFLGVIVGRGTSPVKFFDSENLRTELAALKKAAVEEEIEQIKIESNELNNKPDLGFYEGLKKNRVISNVQMHVSKHAEKEVPEKLPVKKKREGIQRKAETFQPVWEPGPVRNGEHQRKAEISQPVQKPNNGNTGQRPETRKKITIQVASFRNPQDADRMVKRLTARGYAAYKSTGDVPGDGTWHRVRIGSFNKRIEARSTMDKLKKDNLIAILVNE
ncbi:MAG: SPOR domain-containing protein [Desulfobacterales bacterium]|nr:SPOR domain-containing protein [Desulfobacterales bacterium]